MRERVVLLGLAWSFWALTSSGGVVSRIGPFPRYESCVLAREAIAELAPAVKLTPCFAVVVDASR